MSGPEGDDPGRTAEGGAQEPDGPVPPYEGRRESADVDADGADRDGVHVGGATGPVVASGPADDPGSSPLGRTASPDEDAGGTEAAGYPADPGVGPDHQAGVRRGEDEPG